MKHFKKIFLLLIFSGILFTSCSRTGDAIGLDSIYNIVKSGKWNSVYKGTGDNTMVGVQIVPEGGYAKFLGSTIQIYDQAENTVAAPISYSFKSTKTIVIDGVDYRIDENFVSTIKTITARAGDEAKTFYIFKRDR